MTDRRPFRPADPPRTVFDLEWRVPALLLGHWLDETGREVEAVVVTMTHNRPAWRVGPMPAAPAPAEQEPD